MIRFLRSVSTATAIGAVNVAKEPKMRQLAAAIGMTCALMGPERKATLDCPPDEAPPARRTRRRERLVTRR